MKTMQHTRKMPDFNLQLFNDGAAAAGAESAVQSEATGELPKAETTARRGSSRPAKTGAYDNVVSGKQEDAPAAEAPVGTDPAAGGVSEGNANKSGVTTTSNTLESNRKAFEELIAGEYKDAFTERTQQIIDRRFKESKGMEQTIASQKPIIDMLMQKYKIADGDVGKLQKAIEQDDTYWEREADEAGLSIPQYKEMQKLQRDSEELQRLHQIQQAQQQLYKWMQEAEGVKSKFPSFDLHTELKNRDFKGMLKSGVSVETAYKTLHMDEINEATARAAAQTASQQMAASIKAKAARPAENGTSRQSAAIVKSDVYSLSREDRAEVIRRAMRGETIKF
jgi:hypothetical protein